MKEHLGDAVYAEISKFGELVLTTEDDISVNNTIVLEGEVYRALLEYVSRQSWGGDQQTDEELAKRAQKNMESHMDEDDDDLLEDLRAEFLEMAKKGDRRAFDFAIGNSDEFCSVSTEVLMRLVEKIPPAGGLPIGLETCIKIAAVTMAARERLVEAFEKHVADDWATAEYPTRIAAMKAAHEECMDQAEGLVEAVSS